MATTAQQDKKNEFDYRQKLLAEFHERKARNSSYSLRAFARDLGVSPTALSEVFSLKRDFSQKNAAKVADAMGWAPTETKYFFAQVAGSSSSLSKDFDSLQLLEDEFKLISDWYYFVLRYMARVNDHRADTNWLAKKLGLSALQVKEALERLVRMKYLSIRRGKLIFEGLPLKLTTKVPTAAQKKHQRQNLENAKKAMDQLPPPDREITSMTMCVKEEDFEEAKKMIRKFKRQFGKKFSVEEGDEVYTLAVQFFPSSGQRLKPSDKTEGGTYEK